ncbi:MAG TPA: hypothetical protein VN328_02570 [Thermodesulfovibrionales bacterium]|nr:hypothetical protein [Thermodesulfovibrionales bacterium]
MNTNFARLMELVGSFLLILIAFGSLEFVIYETFLTGGSSEEGLMADLKTAAGILLLACVGGLSAYLISESCRAHNSSVRSARSIGLESAAKAVQKCVGWTAHTIKLLGGKLIDALGVGMNRTAKQLRHIPQGIGKVRKNSVALFIAFVLISAAVIFVKGDVLSTRKPVGSQGSNGNWAQGIKQAKSDGYVVTISFLNRESLNDLGLSKEIGNNDFGGTRYANLEIQAEGECIPDSFISAPEKNVLFIDEKGHAVPLDPPNVFRKKGKIIYKSKACGKEHGAVYMKDFIVIRKDVQVNGIAIKLDGRSEIILR